uniref:RING-type domain-containing protein n=1 Tax=Arcella intermedia TaxID=1963864 RepID=A0A6B2LWH5_9EUKA
MTARMACFCLFHKDCIDAWFIKIDKKICPLHGRDHL